MYVRELFREFNATESVQQSTRLVRRYWTRVAALYGALLGFAVLAFAVLPWASRSPLGWLWLSAGVSMLLLMGLVGTSLLKVGFDVLRLLRRLTATLRVAWHEWWFKPGVGWASLAESDGSAEVIEPTGDRLVWPSGDAARGWLTQNDYVSEQQALAEAMVLNAPPPVAVDIGRGMWPVARKPKARVRVEAELGPETLADPTEEDEAARPVAVTARRDTD
jgi:hypothetical protein